MNLKQCLMGCSMKNLYKISLKIARDVISELEKTPNYDYIPGKDKPLLPGYHWTDKGQSNALNKKSEQKDLVKEILDFFEINSNSVKDKQESKKDTRLKIKNLVKNETGKTFTDKQIDKLIKIYHNSKKVKKYGDVSPIFDNTESYINDMKNQGERMVDDDVELSVSLNKTYKIKHESCSSIFKPVLNNKNPYFYEQFIKEKFSFNLDQEIGANVTPPTIISNQEIDGKKTAGSEQFFIEDAKTFNNLMYSDKKKLEEYCQTKKFKSQIERIAILDYLTNNTDRHWENMVFDKEGNVYAIDNGLCMPSKNKPKNLIGKDMRSVAFTFIDKFYLNGFEEIQNVEPYGIEYDEDEVFHLFSECKIKKSLSNSTIEMIKDINIENLKNLTHFNIDDDAFDGMIERAEKLKKLFEG